MAPKREKKEIPVEDIRGLWNDLVPLAKACAPNEADAMLEHVAAQNASSELIQDALLNCFVKAEVKTAYSSDDRCRLLAACLLRRAHGESATGDLDRWLYDSGVKPTSDKAYDFLEWAFAEDTILTNAALKKRTKETRGHSGALMRTVAGALGMTVDGWAAGKIQEAVHEAVKGGCPPSTREKLNAFKPTRPLSQLCFTSDKISGLLDPAEDIQKRKVSKNVPVDTNMRELAGVCKKAISRGVERAAIRSLFRYWLRTYFRVSKPTRKGTYGMEGADCLTKLGLKAVFDKRLDLVAVTSRDDFKLEDWVQDVFLKDVDNKIEKLSARVRIGGPGDKERPQVFYIRPVSKAVREVFKDKDVFLRGKRGLPKSLKRKSSEP